MKPAYFYIRSKCVIRKAGITIVLCFAGVFAFAQTQPRQILSTKDLDSFMKNFEEITDILDEYDEDLEEFTNAMVGLRGEDLTAGLIKLRNSPVPSELQTALVKQGMGSNGFEKIIVILYSLSVAGVENRLEEAAAENSGETDEGDDDYPVEAFILEQLASLKKAIHGSDFSLISSRFEDLFPLIQ
jgi:hypothetical protein